MAFKDNLVYLRRSKNLTQERLAVLLGVSRQAISKWESDRAYPEMDKLVAICDLFDCKLDDLIMGDVKHPKSQAAASASSAVTSPTSGPAQDFTGYDEHWKSFARYIAGGVAMLILGPTIAAALSPFVHGTARAGKTFIPMFSMHIVCRG